MSAATPYLQCPARKFREGLQPKHRLFYQRIAKDPAIVAWGNLVAYCRERPWLTEIRTRDLIRSAMSAPNAMMTNVGLVGRNSADRYRKIWDALGLITNIPGEWNDEKFERPKFDHGSLGEGYSSYSDWSDENLPAVIYVHDLDADAFGDRVKGHDAYVLNRQVSDNEVIAYGDRSLSRLEWFVSRGGTTLRRRTAVVPPGETYEFYEEVDPPSTVLLVETDPLVESSRCRWTHRRSRSPRCCFLIETRPLSGDEISSLTGVPRGTVFRVAKMGELDKVSRGLYVCPVHPLADETTSTTTKLRDG